MKNIFTSYYAKMQYGNNKNLTKVSISRTLPRDLNESILEIDEFKPEWSTLNKYKNGEIDWEGYEIEYLDKLHAINDEKFMKLLDKLEDGCVLLCYEGVNKNCHRHILADYLNLRFSNFVNVKEL